MTDMPRQPSPLKRFIPALCFCVAAFAGYHIAQQANSATVDAAEQPAATHTEQHTAPTHSQPTNTSPAVSYSFTDAFVRETPMKMSAGYVVIGNTTAQDDALVNATADWAGRIELHNVVADEEGVMNMKQVHTMPLPAHGTLSLRPGGYHLMIFDVKDGLRAGESKTITLHFEHTEKQDVTFAVQPIAYQGQQAKNEAPASHDAEHHHHH